ncbi:DUF2220 family protein [Georgenia sp. TF02-10]|uniref:Wadjet anti-phage system protein JetD domain-containing protein n=1 Tax=Georgenia sp. TF02-10 TaxID=2917725 RepID=UPI001FA705DE|nr:Wadjet anti-phage system protein JetD domain-containing protein [Georgenia sp. TF02-10]UNX55175.1 DUF2220 family protein [Georgenia sp. TF02-10]
MRRAMVTVAAAREAARRRYDRHGAAWAVAAALGELDGAPVLDLPLHPPTEADALADERSAVAWVRSWRDAGAPGVQWGRRRWASVGAQDVPERLRVTDPADVARLAGRSPHWRVLRERTAALVGEWAGPVGALAGDAAPSGAAADDAAAGGVAASAVPTEVRRQARALTDLDDADFWRLQEVLRWLVAHPGSGLYVRQLPVRGVDTKWVGHHRGLVTGLVGAITGSTDLGLAHPPDLVRVRFLDPALAPGGLTDVAAPVAQLDALGIAPRTVLVAENLESVVALPPLPGAVAVHGSGYAVERLGEISWVRDGRVLYWGDLDSHGFAILDRLRGACPAAVSVLMDRATLEAHRDLWVPEPTPSRADVARLTPAEAEVLAVLRDEGDVRLEQERLDWATCLATLRAAAG